MRFNLKVSVIFVSSLLVLGCGSKGDLYISTSTKVEGNTSDVKPAAAEKDESPKSTKAGYQLEEKVSP